MLSRVADSLYWMSRYIERAENDARILDVNLQLLLDLGGEADAMQHWAPVIATLEETDLFDSLYDAADEHSVTDFLTLQKKNPNSILSCLTLARENARTTREQISSEMWEQINRLYLFVQSEEAKQLLDLQPARVFHAGHFRLAPFPGSDGRDHDSRRRLGFHPHRPAAGAG